MVTSRPVKQLIGNHGTLRPDPKLAMALGEMTARWSFLEWLLVHLLVELTRMKWDQASAIIYAVNSTRARTDIVQTIAERLPKKDPRRVSAIEAVTMVGRLSGRRNAFTHHMWFSETRTGKVWSFDYRQEPKPQGIAKRQTAHALFKFCHEIADVCRVLATAGRVPVDDAVFAALKMPFTIRSARTSAKG